MNKKRPGSERLNCAILESLERRRLFSTVFSSSDLSGTWILAGVSSAGTIQFDSAGNITGGSTTDDSSNTATPTGTYSITSDGAFTLDLGGSPAVGEMNASKNLIVVTKEQDGSSATLFKAALTEASIIDLTGIWHLFSNGAANTGSQGTSDSGNTGQGTMNFNAAAGTLSGTETNDDNGHSNSFTGSYSVSSTGSISLSVQAGDALSFTGALSSTKDAIILSPTNLASAAANNDSRQLTLIHSAGIYTKASLNGPWAVIIDGNHGTLNFNGDGKVTGSVTGSDGDQTLNGTYAVASNGTFTANLSNGTGLISKFSGAIDASDDVAAMSQPKSGKDDDMALLIRSGSTDHAPTLTTIAPLKGARAAHPFNIIYATLLAASNAADVDGDTISFQIASIGPGTLTLDGSEATVGSLLSSGDSLTWTPVAKAKGNVTAFDVKAYDGTKPSKKAVAVKIAIAKA